MVSCRLEKELGAQSPQSHRPEDELDEGGALVIHRLEGEPEMEAVLAIHTLEDEASRTDMGAVLAIRTLAEGALATHGLEDAASQMDMAVVRKIHTKVAGQPKSGILVDCYCHGTLMERDLGTRY